MQIFTGFPSPIKLGPALTFDLVTTLLLLLISFVSIKGHVWTDGFV